MKWGFREVSQFGVPNFELLRAFAGIFVGVSAFCVGVRRSFEMLLRVGGFRLTVNPKPKPQNVLAAKSTPE